MKTLKKNNTSLKEFENGENKRSYLKITCDNVRLGIYESRPFCWKLEYFSKNVITYF